MYSKCVPLLLGVYFRSPFSCILFSALNFLSSQPFVSPFIFCLRHCCDMKIVLFAFRLFSLFSALICELPGEGGFTIPLIPDLAFVGFPPTFILFISSSQK